MNTKNRQSLRILLLQSAPQERRKLQIDYFSHGFGVRPDQLVGHDSVTASLHPEIVDAADVVVVTGAALYRVSHAQHEQLDQLAELVRHTVDSGKPFLGICYGAHTLAYALGGKVEYMPNRRELGTYDMHVLAPGREDVLFADMPEVFSANCARTDDIMELPLTAVPLVNSNKVQYHAFKIAGKPAYGFQFHPEYDKAAMLIALEGAYKNGTYFEHEDEYKTQREQLQDTPESHALLRNFIDRVVLS